MGLQPLGEYAGILGIYKHILCLNLLLLAYSSLPGQSSLYRHINAIAKQSDIKKHQAAAHVEKGVSIVRRPNMPLHCQHFSELPRI